MRYTYSRREDSDAAGPDADEILDALADDILAEGDIENVLQRVERWGLRTEEWALPGLQHLLQQVRQQRHDELQRYQLDSMLSQLEQEVQQAVEAERAELATRREEPLDTAYRDARDSVLDRKATRLDYLPDELGAQIEALYDYEFLSSEAHDRFHNLLQMLQEHALQYRVKQIESTLDGMRGREVELTKEMLRDLNSMLRACPDDADQAFERFRSQYGDSFPSLRSRSALAEELQAQSAEFEDLLRSVPAEMRHSLEGATRAVLRDAELASLLQQVSDAVDALQPRKPARAYSFRGAEPISLREALELMRRLRQLDELERDLMQAVEDGQPDGVDANMLRQQLGDTSADALLSLQALEEWLREAGYVRRKGASLLLTPRGIRQVGDKVLRDIFAHTRGDLLGKHGTRERGQGVDVHHESRPIRFGDPFRLDISATLMNAVTRGSGAPVELEVRDFAVYDTELQARSSTVLLIDLSRSMPLRGCLVAAKKVTFALHSLIRGRFPKDDLIVVGFADVAREIDPEQLLHVSWEERVYGTNMQHGLMMARRLLARRGTENKQIILITDGEPTAYVQGNEIEFSYPPTFRTFQETLKEVQRCTRENIAINTFMLARGHYLTEFVREITRMNHGRAFFTTPANLGEYVVLDFVRNRTRRVVR